MHTSTGTCLLSHGLMYDVVVVTACIRVVGVYIPNSFDIITLAFVFCGDDTQFDDTMGIYIIVFLAPPVV